MKRVVVTGLGIVSSIGSCVDDVVASLRSGRSGMVYLPEMKALGYRCCIFAPAQLPELPEISPRWRRCLSTASKYGLAATSQAVSDARLEPEHLATPTAGIVFGSGASGRCDVPAPQRPDERLDSPSRAFRMLGCSPAAVLAYRYGCHGPTVSLSAACATGLYNIGHAFELIRSGALDVCLTGSAEGEVWDVVGLSGDNSNGMPADWNDRPTQACRPFDRDRQGFIMTAGAGALTLESLEHARRRGARIYAEVVGYGAANDGHDMFAPSGVGMRLAVEEALTEAAAAGVTTIDYINAHGTGTPTGDVVEVDVLREFFSDGPWVSSTKGQSGHGQGSTASQEAVFTLLMMEHGFIAPTKNLDNIALDCVGVRHVQQRTEMPFETAITVNNGLGGVNACLVLRKGTAEN